MAENLRSILSGLSALYIIAGLALIFTITRRETSRDAPTLNRFVQLFLLGVSCQCLHFLEEFLSGFYIRFPSFLGLTPWSSEFFVTFNVSWIAIWILSAVGIRHHIQAAYFPAWFFAIGMAVNGIAHPLLAVATQGYFPGLVTSPLVGIVGILLLKELWQVTQPHSVEISQL